MFKLRLKKGRSYRGIVFATQEKPYVIVESEAIANAAIASGFFELVHAPADQHPSTGIHVMTIPQLKEYAKINGIDLCAASKKEDILACIETAQTKTSDGISG